MATPPPPGSYAEYKDVYQTLLTPEGLKSLSSLNEDDKAELLNKINSFLNTYPKVEADATTKNVGKMSLIAIYEGCMKVILDIINDVSQTISDKDSLSGAQIRRQIFKAFTSKERILYVGIWLVIIAFIIYFIDIAD